MTYITNVGQSFLADGLTDTVITLSKVELGNGTSPNPSAQTSLVSYVTDATLGAVVLKGNHALIPFYHNNITQGISIPFTCTEIGIYGIVNGEEVLIYYITDNRSIPSNTSATKITSWNVGVVCANENTVRQISVGSWCTEAEARAIIADKNAKYALISGAGNPTSTTVGRVGQRYLDTTNKIMYICTMTYSATEYTWYSITSGVKKKTYTQTNIYTANTTINLQYCDKIDVVLVGGGGGGGFLWEYETRVKRVFYSDYYSTMASGGGGGSGYVVSLTDISLPYSSGATISISVGAGGTAAQTSVQQPTLNQSNGGNGGATSITINGNTYTANGGEGGKNPTNNGSASSPSWTLGQGGAGYNSGVTSPNVLNYVHQDNLDNATKHGGNGGAGYTHNSVTYGSGGRGAGVQYDDVGRWGSNIAPQAGGSGVVIITAYYHKLVNEEDA